MRTTGSPTTNASPGPPYGRMTLGWYSEDHLQETELFSLHLMKVFAFGNPLREQQMFLRWRHEMLRHLQSDHSLMLIHCRMEPTRVMVLGALHTVSLIRQAWIARASELTT